MKIVVQHQVSFASISVTDDPSQTVQEKFFLGLWEFVVVVLINARQQRRTGFERAWDRRAFEGARKTHGDVNNETRIAT